MANTISRRGPGQRLERTTGEPTEFIDPVVWPQWTGVLPPRRRGTIPGRILSGFGRWRLADAAGQSGNAAAFIRLRTYAYARDRSVPGLVRDIVTRRLRLCPGLGPRWDGQA